MTRLNHTRRLALMEEAVTVLFCLIDDAYAHLNPNARRYESLKRLSDSEVITLALFQQLRGTESQRSFLRSWETPSGSSRTCSPGSRGCIPPH